MKKELVLGHCFAGLLTLAAFVSTLLEFGIIRERFAGFCTLGATLCTAIGHQSREWTAPRTDLSAADATGRTVLTAHQTRQVFLLAFGQQMRTMGRAKITSKRAIRARFGTLLHHRIVFRVFRLFFLRFCLLGERIRPNDGKGKHQRYRSSDSGSSGLHGKFP